MKKTAMLILSTVLASAVCLPALKAPDFEKVLKKGQARFASLKDYTATTRKKELIGKNKYKEQWDIDFKFMKPFNIYARIGNGEAKGTEIIFAKGKYNDKLVVHKNGLLGMVDIYLDPRSPLATEGERHPVHESYMGYTIEVLDKNFKMMKEKGKGEVSFVKEEIVDGRKTWHFKASFPPDEGFYAAVILMYFDQETCLLLKIQSFGWDGQLREEYFFAKLKVNAGLTDQDFNIANPAYGFRKR